MIAGIGPSLVDHIYSIDRYPERGGQAIVRDAIKVPGGAAANVIYALASFGLKCRFYSTIGHDNNAKFFIKSMESVGVELKLKVTHPETGRVDIYVDGKGERTFFVHPNAASIVKLGELDYEADLFYLDPFPSKDSFDVHVELARNARKHKKFVALNPGYPYSALGFDKLSELLKYVDLVFFSELEFLSLKKKERDFLKYVDVLVVTMGKKGSKAFTQNKSFYQPAFKVRVVDTTGAGDAFAAGFLYTFLKGMPIDLCLKIGNFVAAYSIQFYGARNLPSVQEIEKIMK
jgi:ribokinase